MASRSEAAVDDSNARRTSRKKLIWSLLTPLILIYVLFLCAISLWPRTMAMAIGDGLTLGLALGCLSIVLGILLSWIYVIWANKASGGNGEQP